MLVSSNRRSPARDTGYWLAQSATLRPARRRGTDHTATVLTTIAGAVLLLVALVGAVG